MQLFQKIKPPKSVGTTFLGLLFFILAFGGALINLPSFIMVQASGPSIYLCIIWRYLCLFVCCLPFLAFDFCSDYKNIIETLKKDIWNLAVLSFFNAFYVYLIYFAVNHTFVAHTILLCSLASTFSCTWKIVKRDAYSTIEYIGIGVNVFGAYLCCCEGDPDSTLIFLIK